MSSIAFRFQCILGLGFWLGSLLGSAAATRYVNLQNTTPAFPYIDWQTAATNIQDAVDLAVAGDLVLVTNGVYETGGRRVYGTTNRLVVATPITVRSVNGPATTVIRGYHPPGAIYGTGGVVRCVYLTNKAVLSGFTLANGSTIADSNKDAFGGAAWCESTDAILTNCILTGNSSAIYGGGVYQGTLDSCIVSNNSGYYFGGGAYKSILNNCLLTSNRVVYGGPYNGGGAAYKSTLSNCIVIANSGASFGGAAYESSLYNCVISSNSAAQGGGVAYSDGNNCVMIGNTGVRGGGSSFGYFSSSLLLGNRGSDGGGAYGDSLFGCTVIANSAERGGGGAGVSFYNSIVYYNKASLSNDNCYFSSVDYSCTTPAPAGSVGTFTNSPLFVDTNGWTNLRLQSNSPCINAGRNANAFANKDLEGAPRIVAGTVDIGAYEYQTPASQIAHIWLIQHGFPLDGTADHADPDGDQFDNYHEWGAGTDPTNAASLLRLLALTRVGTNNIIRWQSVPGQTYGLEAITNLGVSPSFSVVATNIPAATNLDITTFIHTNAPLGYGPWLYRVKAN